MAKSSRGRHRKQKEQASYSKMREDLQLRGQLPTTPKGALRDEVVDPASQDSQRFPGLERQAILNDGSGGWSVPEHVKRKVIEQNAEVLFEKKFVTRTVDGPSGPVEVTVELPPDRAAQQRASNILLLADQRQHERDNPEAAGKARGGVNVTVDNSTKVGILGRLLAEARGAREKGGPDNPPELPAPAKGGGESPGRGDK